MAAISIFVLILSIMAFRSGALPAFSAGQPASHNLTTLSANDITAYRWQAMADFYANQAATAVQYGPPGR